ncbi:MAG TPA: hypothetical protein VFI15_12310 [Candidatus Limnocylindrales bacterium]|nr:hypothetical protein [Candidatus Limnocylindrales bacterium]
MPVRAAVILCGRPGGETRGRDEAQPVDQGPQAFQHDGVGGEVFPVVVVVLHASP